MAQNRLKWEVSQRKLDVRGQRFIQRKIRTLRTAWIQNWWQTVSRVRPRTRAQPRNRPSGVSDSGNPPG